MKLQGAIGLGVAAMTAALGAFAADSHDYTTYDKLKATVEVSGGCPAASCWESGNPMSAETCYLVPSNLKLQSTTASGSEGGEWPAKELAIEGRFQLKVSSPYTSVATIANLALLPGGEIFSASKLFAIIGTTIDVRGTADNPAEIRSENNYDSGDQYPRIYSDLVCGDPSAVLKMVHSVSSDDGDRKHGFRLKGVHDYQGTLVLDGVHTWAQPEKTAEKFEVAGTMELRNGANFLVTALDPSFGNLVIGSGSTFEISKGRAIFIAQSIQLAEGNKIVIANPFGDWAVGPSPAPVKIATFGPSVQRPADYNTVFSMTLPSNAKGGVPSLVFSEQVQDDGSVDVYVTYRAVVKVGRAQSGKTPYNPTSPDYSMLSDYEEGGENGIWPENDYYTVNATYCQGGAYTFPGHSLTVADNNKVCCYGCVFTCSNLYLVSGGISQPNCGNVTKVAGKLHLQQGSVEFGANQSNFRGGVELQCDIDGTTDLQMTRAVSGDDTAYKSFVTLSGENTAFSGKFALNAFNAELRVTKKESLGGALAAAAADGVSIADTSALKLNLTEDTVFDDVTRGWTFNGASTLAVADAVSVTLLNPVTIAGTLTKTGAKNLSVASVSGGTLVVSEGSLSAAASGAFANLPSLTFAEGTLFVVDAATTDETLKASGADLSGTGVSAPDGGVTVVFENVTQDVTIAVATFASEADAAKFVFKRPRGYTAKRTVEKVGDKYVLKATLEKSGLMLIFR